MEISFARNAWNTENLTYAYSWRFDETPEFIQRENCIESRENPGAPQKFDNITLLFKDPFGPGTRISTRCAFDRYGAPLIVLAADPETDSRGVLRYGDYLEIVLYEEGINVWRMWRREGKVSWKKLMSCVFPVSAMQIHTLTVEAGTEQLKIRADDREMSLYIPDFYPIWYGGIVACEGVNRFYSLTAEEIAEK